LKKNGVVESVSVLVRLQAFYKGVLNVQYFSAFMHQKGSCTARQIGQPQQKCHIDYE
jgi:hypothetical protein